MRIDGVAVLKLQNSLLLMATYWVDGARRMAYDITSHAQVQLAETIFMNEADNLWTTYQAYRVFELREALNGPLQRSKFVEGCHCSG